ncbi:hypothetical protein UCREL1_1501 [Eutypa lata UCREL1]|uniref:Uncharacterized protein n=1 Tax=Eutypa lata (strain UCR-EL1) TaxID=1287681 RepID=M7T3I6_EUTLA|nr:hypothetical protein UCREL1_1501 [Eutypa lata UCREL1]
MSVSAPTPPLLLTKRLTAFLQSNLTPQIHTALLATLSGKLLAHASTQSVNTLRTQCTVAASLWAIYSAPASANTAIPESLPPHQQSSSTSTSASTPKPSAITIQLTGAVMVLRLLKCGLLFVCFGPPPEGGAGVGAGAAEHTSQRGGGGGGGGSTLLQPSQPPSETGNPTPTIGSPSEVESIKSAGGATVTSITTTGSVSAAGVVVVRRQAEDLARWLDDKLGSLGVPEEGAAFESR